MEKGLNAHVFNGYYETMRNGNMCFQNYAFQVTKQWGPIPGVEGDSPCARGWYAYTSLDGDLLVHGGLDHKNERLGDMFVLRGV